MNCYVLIGGRSARMGAPKGEVRLGGRSFLERVRDAAGNAFDEVIAIDRAGGSPSAQIETITEDEHGASGAIFGLERALADARGEKLWLLGIDYPLVTTALLRDLRERFEKTAAAVLVPWWGGHPQPLCAGYAPEVRAAVSAAIGRGDLRMRALLGAVEAEHVLERELRVAHAGEPLLNVNDPETLELARRLCEEADASR